MENGSSRLWPQRVCLELLRPEGLTRWNQVAGVQTAAARTICDGGPTSTVQI